MYKIDLLKSTANFVSFGTLDRHDAKQITELSQRREERIRKELEQNKKRTQKSLYNLGTLKVDVYSTTIEHFSINYAKVGKIDLSPLTQTQAQLDGKLYKQELAEMQKVSSVIKELGIVVGGGAIGGVIATSGALGLATVIGTASTGTAIGTLSGAAATNATLAWLGGGAISAGGAGMAGGMVVLCGVALAPITILGMFMATKKASQKVNTARNYNDEVELLVERVNTLNAELATIRRGIYLYNGIIRTLDGIMQMKLNEMDSIFQRLDERQFFKKKIIDPIMKQLFKVDIFTNAENQIIMDACNTASLLRQLIDKTLLNEEGGFLSYAYEFAESKKELIASMQKSTYQ